MDEEDRDRQFWAEYRAFWRRPEVIIVTVAFVVASAFAAVRGSSSAVAWCLILWSVSLGLSRVVRRALRVSDVDR